jgi:hypothetical protein
MMLLHNNFFPAATLSGGVWLAPLSEMQDPRPRRKSRSSGVDTANTQFKIDFGRSIGFKAWALTNTNLTVNALYRVTWYSDAFVTAVANSGWLAPPGYPTEDPDNVGTAIVHLFGGQVTARYWKVEIDDHNNLDGYVEIGVGFTGECWQPATQFAKAGNNDLLEANTAVSRALGGTPYFNRRTPVRVASFGFSNLTLAVAGEVRRIRKIAGIDKQVFFIPNPDDPSQFNELAFLATMREMPAIQRIAAGYSTTGFTLAEAV